jgi:hypothetical protein
MKGEDWIKLEAFMELLEGLNGQSALVFYNFKHDLVIKGGGFQG